MTAAAPQRAERGDALKPDAGREAIWNVVHEVWQLLDDSSEGPAGREIDEARWQSLSEAMDALEALVPDSEGPFWGGFPVNFLWPKALDRDALIALIMEETTDQVVADGWLELGKPNVLVQGCRYIRRNAPPSPEGYAHPEEAAKNFAGFIADRILAAFNPS